MSERFRLLWRAALAGMALALSWQGAQAERLVVDLATDLVEVTSEFGGTSIALFGVVERDGQTVSRPGRYDVVITVRGPPHDVLVQRKARRLGIIVNTDGQLFPGTPSYWGVFTTPADDDTVDRWLSLVSDPDHVPAHMWEDTALIDAVSAAREEAGLWTRQLGGVEMLTERFFRTSIPLPGLVEHGTYDIDVVLLSGGVPLDTATTSFKVFKVGFEQKLFSLSRNQPLIYGVGVLALAILTGYVGGVVFRRN
ncbi:MAG: TIGR02186 family protein [Pseudomonadota bacterium]